MITIKAPATSANLGPGFDCLGLALGLYDQFTVAPAAVSRLENVEPRFSGPDNLFLKAYGKASQALGLATGICVRFDCLIPSSRGLGSSAALSAAGLTAAWLLAGRTPDRSMMLRMATELEGHPDNAAPCLLGGLTAVLADADGTPLVRQLPIDGGLMTTALIPDVEVPTAQARALLPDSYPRPVAAANAAMAVMLTAALAAGDMALLKAAARDRLHEPYRQQLIPGFAELKRRAEKDTDGVMVISGSGSSCLLFSRRPLSGPAVEAIQAGDGPHWTVMPLPVAHQGIQYKEDSATWRTIF